MDPERKGAVGYDRMAEGYLRSKDPDDSTTLAALDELARDLPPGGAVLDLGCGAGVPVTQWLARRFRVTGVDISARQLELARERVPEVTLIEASMIAVDFAPGSFDAAVAFHSIIHVPRAEQPALLRRIHRWLKPGGAFLATWAVREWEGKEEDWEGWGATMWWSHYDADTNLQMLRVAGFGIMTADMRTSGEETWLWVQAHKE